MDTLPNNHPDGTCVTVTTQALRDGEPGNSKRCALALSFHALGIADADVLRVGCWLNDRLYAYADEDSEQIVGWLDQFDRLPPSDVDALTILVRHDYQDIEVLDDDALAPVPHPNQEEPYAVRCGRGAHAQGAHRAGDE